MTADGPGRPQDQARRHRRVGTPSSATTTLLAAWQSTLRDELRAIVDALGARKSGLIPDLAPEFTIALDDPRRDRLVDRGIRVGRELGTEVDPTPAPGQGPATPATRARRPRKVDFGPS
jgi:hypothetical protein